MTERAERSQLRETVVEIFDILAKVNERLAEPFDIGRIKVALVCRYVFSEPGHLCQEGSGCSNVVHRYRHIRPTDVHPGRAQRIDGLFDAILRADAVRERLRATR